MEIERKFLVTDPPNLERCERAHIEQGYLALAGDGDVEVRLRRRNGELWLTIKGGSGEVRTEEEIELDRERFEALWPLTDGRRVAKMRHLVPLGDLRAEVDRYEGDLEGLITAEVEFNSEEEARAFRPPRWFGRELTGDHRYMNENLAIDGLPHDL